MPESPAILRLREVLARRGRARSPHYLDIKAGLFTPPIHVGVRRGKNEASRSVGWPQHEVDALIKATIAGKSEDEIRVLVRSLVAARKQAA